MPNGAPLAWNDLPASDPVRLAALVLKFFDAGIKASHHVLEDADARAGASGCPGTGSSHAGYGTIRTHCSAVCQPAGRPLAPPGTPNSPEPTIRAACTADLWIAATALAFGMPVVTRNERHFARVPELNVIGYG